MVEGVCALEPQEGYGCGVKPLVLPPVYLKTLLEIHPIPASPVGLARPTGPRHRSPLPNPALPCIEKVPPFLGGGGGLCL